METMMLVATAEAQEDLQVAVVAWNNIGIALSSQGNLTGAIDAFREATKRNPSYSDAWANMGIALYNNSSYLEAIQAFDKCTSIDRTNKCIYYAKGLAYEKLGNRSEANKAYGKAGFGENASKKWEVCKSNFTVSMPPLPDLNRESFIKH